MGNRKQALKSGKLTYVGKPCKEGHTERYTSCNKCVVCNSESAIKKRKMTEAQIRDKREKEEYNRSKRQEAKEKGLKRFIGTKCNICGNREKFVINGKCAPCSKRRQKETKKKRISNNKEKTYVPDKPCKRGHKLRRTSSGVCVKCDNEKAMFNYIIGENNIAERTRATPSWASIREIAEIYKEARDRTNKSNIHYEVDHIIPIRGKLVSGLHVPWNLRIIPRQENRAKRNNLVFDPQDPWIDQVKLVL